MHVNITYDTNFTDLILHLKSKYGQKLFDLDGIGNQLDINKFSKEFFSTKGTTADVSVDSNSNISTKDMIVYNTELPKPYFRFNAYYLVWKKLKQLYNQVEANRIIERQLIGDFYINDFHGVNMPYCYNYSTYDIALNGLTMVNKIKSIAPKHLYAFKSQLEQFVVNASNSTLGAVGLADLFIVMGYYVDKILETKSDAGFRFAEEEDCWKYVTENLVSFIYTINQPSRANQSPFTNVSIFDDGFLESLAPEYVFPDGRVPKMETIKRIQELFIDTMNNELKRTPVTFPVTTACFSVNEDNEILDQSFLKMISEKNREFGFINIYCGKTSTLSSCCFEGKQKVDILDSNDNQVTIEFKKLIKDRFYKVRHKDEYVDASLVRIYVYGSIYDVIMEDGYKMKCTADHLFKLFGGIDTKVEDIKVGDELEKYVDGEVVPYKVKSTNKVKYRGYVYCFKIENQDDPYFTLPNGLITHNCRLRSDTSSEYFNSFGSGSTKIGSLGVVTVNLPRLAYKNKDDEEGFLKAVEDVVGDVARINNSKRHIIKRRIENDAQPLYTLGYMDINKQYSTCGLNGINEALEILGYDILTEEGINFCVKMLEVINNTNDKFQKKYKAPHNCEQTPSENSSIKLANKDDLMGYNLGYLLYSNQLIPLTTKADMLDRIRLQGIFDKHFSGGCLNVAT